MSEQKETEPKQSQCKSDSKDEKQSLCDSDSKNEKQSLCDSNSEYEKHDQRDLAQQEEKKAAYQEYVRSVTPKHSLVKNCARAFLVGGLICTLGQCLLQAGQALGLDPDTAAGWCSMILVFLSVVFTACGWYQPLAKFGGAGTLVPVTGFANSVAAPAIEFQKEGQVFGIGCKIFTIAGPVLLYGIFSSWLLGLGYWLLSIGGF